MSGKAPEVPAGSGQHPIPMVAIAANDLSASAAFYAKLFAWQLSPFSNELTAAITPAGPSVSLLANVPEGSQGTVPFIGTTDVDSALARAVAAGGSIERIPYDVVPVGRFARFKDASGTVYGLTDAVPPGGMPSLGMPFGADFKTAEGTVCSVEMYAADGAAAAYLHVKDVVAKIADIEAAGGKRLGDPMPVPGLATFGYFTDPSGTSVGLIGP